MSEIRATTISDAAGTGPITLTGQSAAKAWVNFNGSGTVATRDSVNVSTLTDLGTGHYGVSFTNYMVDDGFSSVAQSQAHGTRTTYGGYGGSTCCYYIQQNSFRILVSQYYSMTLADAAEVSAANHGDLA